MTIGRRRLLSGGGGLAVMAIAGCSTSDRGDRRAAASTSAPRSSVAATATATATGQDERVGTTPQRVEYGPDASQFVELSLPAPTPGAPPVPVAVIIHGGFWRDSFDLSLGRPLAESLPPLGWAALNIEYRRLGGGGGAPATLDDVGAAIDVLAGQVGDVANRAGVPLDLARIVTIGHSAGGHLAVWAATRTDPRVGLAGAVSQAGVLDLRAAAADRLGGGAAQELLGGEPDEISDRYDEASPIEQLPIGIPLLCVHGRDDAIVPLAQSETFVAAATAAGDTAELAVVDGDHFVVIDPASATWRTVLEWIQSIA